MLHAIRSLARPFLVTLVAAFVLGGVVSSPAIAGGHGGAVHVRGYFRKDGTYVAPYYRSSPDGNFYNNWSTLGNVNPYTGTLGTETTPPPSYGSDVFVHGYWRSDGTYVQPHYRSAPDGDPYNNWSTKGNVNPYTGQEGTKTPDPPLSTYYSPVEMVQLGLLYSGYDPGPVDGVVGTQTQRAFANFAHATGCESLPLATQIGLLGYTVRSRSSYSDLSDELDRMAGLRSTSTTNEEIEGAPPDPDSSDLDETPTPDTDDPADSDDSDGDDSN